MLVGMTVGMPSVCGGYVVLTGMKLTAQRLGVIDLSAKLVVECAQ